MDDGKCLLDVISDPQALKEFFRSTSQIAFVDGNTSPVKQESVETVKQNKGNIALSHGKQTTIHTSNPALNSGGLLSQQQTKPLVHFPSTSDLNKHTSPFTTHIGSLKNGIPGHVSSSAVHIPYCPQMGPGRTTLNTSLNTSNPISDLQKTVSSIQTTTSVSLGKDRSPLTRTNYVNSPISFAFNDANKTRNLLSGGAQVVLSNEKTGASISKPHSGQQVFGYSGQLITPPSYPNMVPGIASPNRTTNIKGSPLPPLRPKNIIPRPLTSQNVTTGISGEQHNVPIGVQSNLLPQGVKGKVVVTTKAQPLIAIQPKLIITSQGNVVNQNTLNIGKPSQALPSNFTINKKLQTQNQVLNSLVVQQPKSGIQSGNQVTAGSVSLANLVQLQPKQIAPKPQEHSVSFPVAAKQKITQDQIQQQLVQSILAQTQQKQSQQFAAQSNVVQNEQASNNGDKESIPQHQNHLKDLVQRTQMLQQVMQVRRVQQQQQQQQQQNTPTTGVQLTTTAATPSQLDTNQTALQSLIKSNLVRQGQPKLQHPSVQQTSTSAIANLANQMKNPVNTKQLQEFLEKNPALAQQLKQLNFKQANITGNINTAAVAASSVKNVVQLPKPVKPVVTSQVAAPATKKVVIASPGVQPQTLVINQTTKVGTAPQKVLIVQQSNTGAATTVGQPRVLLQTKEGRPILLSQEQFRQIQQQLAAKNLNLQGKLVTATTKAQVVLKPNDASSVKAVPKVTTSTTTPTTQVKQDITKGVKRPIKAVVESEESKLIKRMKSVLQKDQNSVSVTGLHKPFKNHEDAVKNLLPFHVFSEPEPNARMQRKANLLLNKLATQLTNKSDRMINKYRQLLLGDLQRDVPSAELVMVNRIFLADEKHVLMEEKKMVIEEAQSMAQAIAANSKAVKQENNLAVASLNLTTNENNNDMELKNEMHLFPTSTMTNDEELSLHLDASEQQIDIMDTSPSPMTSANSFLSDLSRTSSELSLTQNIRTPSCTPEPS